jgi:hypothetical protein
MKQLTYQLNRFTAKPVAEIRSSTLKAEWMRLARLASNKAIFTGLECLEQVKREHLSICEKIHLSGIGWHKLLPFVRLHHLVDLGFESRKNELKLTMFLIYYYDIVYILYSRSSRIWIQ